MSNPKRLHVEYATKEDMEAARESSKDQPVPRKTEPALSSDSWQQEWGRDERTNMAKVFLHFQCLLHFRIINMAYYTR